MKLSEDYLLTRVFGQPVLIPVGQAIMDHKSMMQLNETGFLIAEKLLSEKTMEQLLESCFVEMNCSEDERHDMEQYVMEFIYELRKQNVLHEKQSESYGKC